MAYLVNSFTGLLLPSYANAVDTFTFPALTGEVAFVLWLLIKGAKERALNPPPDPGGRIAGAPPSENNIRQ